MYQNLVRKITWSGTVFFVFFSLSLQAALSREVQYYDLVQVLTAVTSQIHVSGTQRCDIRRTVTDFSKDSQDKAFLDTLVLTTKTVRFIETSVTTFQSIDLNITEYAIFKDASYKRGGELLEIILPNITSLFLMSTEMHN